MISLFTLAASLFIFVESAAVYLCWFDAENTSYPPEQGSLAPGAFPIWKQLENDPNLHAAQRLLKFDFAWVGNNKAILVLLVLCCMILGDRPMRTATAGIMAFGCHLYFLVGMDDMLYEMDQLGELSKASFSSDIKFLIRCMSFLWCLAFLDEGRDLLISSLKKENSAANSLVPTSVKRSILCLGR